MSFLSKARVWAESKESPSEGETSAPTPEVSQESKGGLSIHKRGAIAIGAVVVVGVLAVIAIKKFRRGK